MVLTPTERKRCAEIKKTEKIVDWDPNFKFSYRITFKGDQFEAWTEEMIPFAKGLHIISDIAPESVKKHGVEVSDETYLYRRKFPTHIKCSPGFLSWRTKSWTERAYLEIWAPGKPIGQVYFDRPISTIVLSRLHSLNNPWMGLTPNEVFTQRNGIRRGKGNVLIAGLGLGWFTREVLKRKQVKHVTVVEINKELVAKFGKPMMKEYPGRLKVVSADVWTYVEQHDDYDSYLFDIWLGWPDAHYDRTFQAFKSKYDGKVWGWGDCATYPTGGGLLY